MFEIETRLDGDIVERDVSMNNGNVTRPFGRGDMMSWAHALRETEGISAT
jgi:hypothetical protein